MKLGLRWYGLITTVSFLLWTNPSSLQATALGEASPAPQTQNAPQSPQPTVNQGQRATPEEQKPQEKKTEEKKEPSDPDSMEDLATSDQEPNDPLEPINRVLFGINDMVDFLILRPFAEIYRAVTPEPIRNGVTNVLDNLFTPVAFLNHLLQFEGERATATLFRFVMNSSFGIFGLVDVTSDLGYPRYDTDFNQTLEAWGVDTGPYLVLPLIGPSSFRGTAGLVGDYYADPLNLYLNNRHHRKYNYWLTVRYAFDILSHREKVIETIDNIRSSSPDFYVTMRSIYFQRQAYMAEKRKSPNTSVPAKEEKK